VKLWLADCRAAAKLAPPCLLKIVDDPRLVAREKYRSLLLLHYFGYFRRNPDDPPTEICADLISGFRIWSATTMPGISQRHSEQRVSIKGLKKGPDGRG